MGRKEGVEAELPGASVRRGEHGGCGNRRRWRRWFSGEREREQGKKGRARESESGAGQLRGFVRGIEGVRGKQEVASRGEVARARAGERRAHARPPGRGGRRQGRGARRAGPPPGWAGLLLLGCAGEEPQVSPSFLLFLFSIFFLTLFGFNKYIKSFNFIMPIFSGS